MIVSFDVTGIFLLIVLPPIIVFLCGSAWGLRNTVSNYNFNKILERNVELQREILDLKTKINKLNRDILISDELDKEKMEALKDAETEIKLLNSYLVEKGLAEDYIRWKKSEGE